MHTGSASGRAGVGARDMGGLRGAGGGGSRAAFAVGEADGARHDAGSLVAACSGNVRARMQVGDDGVRKACKEIRKEKVNLKDLKLESSFAVALIVVVPCDVILQQINQCP